MLLMKAKDISKSCLCRLHAFADYNLLPGHFAYADSHAC